MKVLNINAVYGAGSTGVIVHDIHKLLLKNGVESYVAYSTSYSKRVENGYQIGGKIGKKLHAFLCRINGKQAYFSRHSTKKFIRYIEKINPDIVNLHNLHSNYINLNMFLKHLAEKDIKTVVTLHDCWFFTGGCFHYTNEGCFKWKEACGNCPKKKKDTPAFLFDCSAKILKDRKTCFGAFKNLTAVGVSDWITNESKTIFKEAITIHNGVDTETFSDVQSDIRKSLNIEGKFVILGPASKWLASHNMEALKTLRNSFSSDTEIILFGCPSGANLPQGVRGISFIRDAEKLAEVYSSADVFANVTREDSLPTINLEAQSAGTPVVTYDATGAKETVNGECGFSVETGNIEEMIEKIRFIKEKGRDFFKEDCRNWILAEYDREKNYLKYLELYRKLAEEK